MNLQPYLATRTIASNPFGAHSRSPETSLWKASGLRDAGISTTSICLPSSLLPNWSSDETADVAHALVGKLCSPTMLFAVALFPLPFFPITAMVSFFPGGSSMRKKRKWLNGKKKKMYHNRRAPNDFFLETNSSTEQILPWNFLKELEIS